MSTEWIRERMSRVNLLKVAVARSPTVVKSGKDVSRGPAGAVTEKVVS
jgi:hypothetical protein